MSDSLARTLRPLLLMLIGSLVVVAGAVVAAPALGLRLSPLPWTILAIFGSVAWWTMRQGWPPAENPVWPDHQAELSPTPGQADLRTQRLAEAMRSAQPHRAFTSRDIAFVLAEITRQRLVRRHGAASAQPWSAASGLLSPALLSYLASTESDHSPPLSRAQVRRFLQEINDL